MKRGFYPIVLLCSLAAFLRPVASANAQALGPPPRLSSPRFVPYAPFLGRPAVRTLARENASSIPPSSYAIEGAAIGGGTLGLATAILTHDLCAADSAGGSCLLPTLGGALIGGLIGVVIGGLAGSFFPKGS
ncbi:MAG: hypothetical protein ABJC74_17895 [Gemmatimonadota bacterium]